MPTCSCWFAYAVHLREFGETQKGKKTVTFIL